MTTPEESAGPRGPRRVAWVAGAYALAVLALAVAGALLVVSVSHYDNSIHDKRGAQPSAARAAAIDAARREVVALLTVSDRTASQDVEALLAGATADFHTQLQNEARSFQQALSQGKVTSTGAVAAAGLVTIKGRVATVAIAARATVKNASSPAGEARNYRLTVTVQQIGRRWLVSGLNFVV